jgi:tubulin---tyrosine ligase
VVLPHQQRSWIGKAHFAAGIVKPTYFRPGMLYRNDGTVHHLPRDSLGEEGDSDAGDEWILIDSTPAACVQVGLYHYFQDCGPVDLVVSGPNFGRNTTAIFSLSSGTIGAALEAAVCGKKAIALSFAFSIHDRDPTVIAEATSHSLQLIQYLYDHWGEDVDLYSINVPLEPGVSENKILYTAVLANRWANESCLVAIDPDVPRGDPELEEDKPCRQGEGLTGVENGIANDYVAKRKPRIQHKNFRWAPNVSHVYRSVDYGEPGNDGWVVKEGMTRYVSPFSCLNP